MRYQVDTAKLVTEVDDVGAAVRDLSRVRVGERLSALATAAPGSATAAAAPGLRRAWGLELAAAAAGLRSLGEGLAAAAETYTSLESATGRAFSARPRGSRS